MILKEIITQLEQLSPTSYALDWDNVGLMVGDVTSDVTSILVALDATNEVITEAIEKKVDLIITHHPLIFKGIYKVNTQSLVGNKVYQLASHGIACYSMHTNYDVVGGMAELAAQMIQLQDAQPLDITIMDSMQTEGIGRVGMLQQPETLEQLVQHIKGVFQLPYVTVYEAKREEYQRIAISPGSGKGEIEEAIKQGAQALITGDIGHHEGLDASEMGLTILDATHYGLEHIFTDFICKYLQNALETIAEGKETIVVMPAKQKNPAQIM